MCVNLCDVTSFCVICIRCTVIITYLFTASTQSSADNNTRTRSGPRKRRFMEKDEDMDFSNLLGYQVMQARCNLEMVDGTDSMTHGHCDASLAPSLDCS